MLAGTGSIGAFDLGLIGLRPALSYHDLLAEGVAHDTMLVALAKRTKIKLTELAPQFFIGMSAKTHPGARAWRHLRARAASARSFHHRLSTHPICARHGSRADLFLYSASKNDFLSWKRRSLLP